MRLPFLVGGSHLYLKAVLEGYAVPEVPPDEAFRARAALHPLDDLIEELQSRDPKAMQIVDLQNPRRVIRALEVCRAGHLFSDSYKKEPLPDPVLKLGLNPPLETLRERAEKRIRQMLEHGWLDEVRNLPAPRLRELKIIGYTEMLDHLEGKLTLGQAIELTLQATMRLAKKQRTWYRKEENVHWSGHETALQRFIDRNPS